ncbi:hypothetical protein [Glycomyces harbinensis]|uniref:WD40-like Beta Propeller Repeat n=1 Tax=Glycomyces harbinensis TaxID=58114 RepID=A0A1G6WF57_9ACTN|nr:hypothetical protein [Glycomyces harbinensis]SDD64580.1 hypothetical protein SAMN05216270_10613 [Glycomyces harbinensis]
MPDSIRELLQGIAGDEPGPSRDLASGALKRARGIGRRRVAAGALGVVVALALAGAGVAGIVNARGADPVPPADDPSSTVDDPSSAAETATPDDEDVATGCGVRPGDWEEGTFPARGDSDSAADLDGLPAEVLFRMTDAALGDRSTQRVLFGPGEEETSGLDVQSDYLYHPAPDGVRALAVDRGDQCGAAYVELNDFRYEGPDEFAFATEQVISVEPVHCTISWSPDSNKVLFHEPIGFEDPKGYMLDVSTGALTELPEALGCGAVWLPDGEFVWDGQSTVMRPDGSDATELPGLADHLIGGDDLWWPTGVSADGGEVCAQDYREEEGDIDPWTCDFYVDTATGDELELPVEGDSQQVVFLADGSMLELVEVDGTRTVYLIDPAGAIVEELTMSGMLDGELELLSYFTE